MPSFRFGLACSSECCLRTALLFLMLLAQACEGGLGVFAGQPREEEALGAQGTACS